MSDSINNQDVYPLFIKLFENCVSDEELQWLDDLFSTRPDMVERYCEFGMNYAAVRMKLNDEVDVNEAISQNDGFDTRLWSELARHEKSAPSIEIHKEELQRASIQRAQYQTAPSRANKSSLMTVVFCAAAVIFLVLFIRLSDMFRGQEVATLTNSLNARGSFADGTMYKGVRLKVGRKPLTLQGGLVELQFDNEARFVIEAPAEFQILSEDRINLRYGQLYAIVPQQAVGFSVYTENAKVIDLGTEFGIGVDGLGETALHIIKGHVQLIAGEKANTLSTEVNAGTAKRVSATDGRVFDIPFDPRKFARQIHPEANIAWRGEPLELASIIAGGNGFDPVFRTHTLNPNTGDYEVRPLVSEIFFTNAAYNQVTDNVFIDGVFVPDGGGGPVTITSQGHRFNCPATCGKFNRNIAVFYQTYDRSFSDAQPALFDGIVYGSEQYPCVLLHSNIGITIDLNHIREAYPGLTIQQLRTGYGLTWAERHGGVNFFILVDGILKHEIKDLVSRENSHSVTVALEPNARFLTFVVADNLESAQNPEDAIDRDFFFLLNPQLVFQ